MGKQLAHGVDVRASCQLQSCEGVTEAVEGDMLGDAILPISEEALALCGERGEGQVFKKLTPNLVAAHLKDWIKAAGITKHITFHCFRHTFATLQLAGGTDIYTVSKLLTHSNLATTQVYAEVVNELKRDASERISLKDDARKTATLEETQNKETLAQ